MAFLWVVTLVGAVVGGLIFIGTTFGAKSAPQEAAGYAMAVACVVIPYVFTRACEGLTDWQRKLIGATEAIGLALQASAHAPVRGGAAVSQASGGERPQTTSGYIDALRAGGCTVTTHNGGWAIVSQGGAKHYAYSDNDLRRWADRFGASPTAASIASADAGSALDRIARSGFTVGKLKE